MEKQRNKLLCENNGAPAGWLLQQEKALLQGGAAERSGRTVLWIDVFPLCVHSHLTRLIRPPPSTGPSRCSDRLQPLQLQQRDVAAAVLQQQHFLYYQLCAHGAFMGCSETGLLLSNPTTFEYCILYQNHIQGKSV